MGLERSSAARFATTIFHENYNDFDVYIEDTADGYQKIFAILLSNALGGEFTLERVYPLGGRKAVIDAAKAEEQKTSHRRKSVFIVDGDLYLLTGEKDLLPQNTFSLPCYCVENILLDKEALVDLMFEETSNKTRSKLEMDLNFEHWLDQITNSLKTLFTIFAASHYLESGISTTSRGHSCITKNHLGEICYEKTSRVYAEIYDELVSLFGKSDTDRAISFVKQHISTEKCFVSTYVSAKDFSLPLLLTRFRTITHSKCSNLNFKIRLASKARTERLAGISAQITQIMKNGVNC